MSFFFFLRPSSSSSSPQSLCLICTVFIFLVLFLINVEGFEPLIQLPHSPAARPRLETKILYVNQFGAKGDGVQDDTDAFRNAWKIACASITKASIVIPHDKKFLVRPISFGGPCRAKVTVTISGTIIAPKDPDVWHGLNPQKWLYFHGVNHLTVRGSGIINGRGHKWWSQSCKINATNPCEHAPTAIIFHRCKKLRLLLVAQILMELHISSSSRVNIKDSIIRTGDDCISIVGNSSIIRIKNIACGPGHGISVGSLGMGNSWAQVHDVIVDQAFLAHTKNGLRIKTWQGGRGFASQITFQNVLMENVSHPIIIDQYYCDSLTPCLNQTLAVKVANISYVSIKGTSATEESVRFACSDSFPCEKLYLEEVQLLSYTGKNTSSFCWEAQGLTSGSVDPPACFSSNGTFIGQKADSGSALQSF
ncbi:putative polygalacturonase [Vitis vinifera]|uniref:Putative polygalacturonase n=1 Tax=Vitis vinifera TaxID=29760 RepID=A0A438HAZ3_VITVI|nr:putative polygalacturonase [Vitis vinifera]